MTSAIDTISAPDAFTEFDIRQPLEPGKTYRAQLKIPRTFQKWYRDALTNAVKFADFVVENMELVTVEIQIPTVTNPKYFYLRITFRVLPNKTVQEAAALNGAAISAAIVGVLFGIILATAVLNKFEVLSSTAQNTIFNPGFVIGAVLIVFLLLKYGRHAK